MRSLRIFLVAGVLAGVAGLLYAHLTKDLETYGIHDAHARPLSEQVPEGLVDMKASTCGTCHTEIYAEWQATVHAQAWTEDYFQTDWAYDSKKQNCLNCHTPMKNQQTRLLIGFEDDDFWKPVLEPNPDFDAAFQQEGVTCAACHVRNGSVMGPHGVKDAPHATTYNPDMRSGMEVCVRCHVTGATNEVSIGSPNICTTMNEIEAGKIRPNCIDCHMPPVTRPLVEGYPARKGRHHYWRGGHDPAMVSKDLDIAIKQVSKNGDRYTYEISLTNIGTHHKLPTGTPDRNIVITMSLLDEGKRIIKTKTHKIVRRILWRPIVIELSDNRLEFNKPQVVEFSFDIESSSRHYLSVKADYNFLEQWRRDQLKLPASSHAGYPLLEKVVEIR